MLVFENGSNDGKTSKSKITQSETETAYFAAFGRSPKGFATSNSPKTFDQSAGIASPKVITTEMSIGFNNSQTSSPHFKNSGPKMRTQSV